MDGMQRVLAIREERADPPAGIRTLRLDSTHRWIDDLEPGRVRLTWQVDPAYFNLDEAVICSWIAALGDQAIFFAGTSLCGEREGTRMAGFSLTIVEDITAGTVQIAARIDRRLQDQMFATCDFVAEDDRLLARMSAVLDVTAEPTSS